MTRSHTFFATHRAAGCFFKVQELIGLEAAVRPLIVSITKFSIVINPPRAYLSRNRRAITGVRFELFVIGYPRDSLVNYARFNGFLLSVSYSFQTYEKRYGRVS